MSRRRTRPGQPVSSFATPVLAHGACRPRCVADRPSADSGSRVPAVGLADAGLAHRVQNPIALGGATASGRFRHFSDRDPMARVRNADRPQPTQSRSCRCSSVASQATRVAKASRDPKRFCLAFQAKILCTDQPPPTTPRSSPTKPPEPLGFHNSVSPLVLRHKIPDWPSPLKSPVPTICQLVLTTPRS